MENFPLILSFFAEKQSRNGVSPLQKLFSALDEYKNRANGQSYGLPENLSSDFYIYWIKEENLFRTKFWRYDTMIRRGELYYADLSPVVGSEQGGIRPVLVVQNDVGNKFSPTVIAAAVTSQLNKAKLPTHIELAAEDYGLPKDSVVLLEQIRTLDKRRLKDKIGELPENVMSKVNRGLLISLGFAVNHSSHVM